MILSQRRSSTWSLLVVLLWTSTLEALAAEKRIENARGTSKYIYIYICILINDLAIFAIFAIVWLLFPSVIAQVPLVIVVFQKLIKLGKRSHINVKIAKNDLTKIRSSHLTRTLCCLCTCLSFKFSLASEFWRYHCYKPVDLLFDILTWVLVSPR